MLTVPYIYTYSLYMSQKNVKKNADGVYIHDAFLGKYPCLKLLISFVKFPYSAIKRGAFTTGQSLSIEEVASALAKV